jgi:catechol 2,3-dioxygenase-like lactoylglutathione lyase family enzyme
MGLSLGYVIFYVEDVTSTITWFGDAFGLGRRLLTPQGDYGELDTGATTLAFASLDLASSGVGGARFVTHDASGPALAASVTLVAADVPAALATASAAGGIVVTEPTTTPWGQTVAYVRDPNGILVELATAVTGPPA